MTPKPDDHMVIGKYLWWFYVLLTVATGLGMWLSS